MRMRMRMRKLTAIAHPLIVTGSVWPARLPVVCRATAVAGLFRRALPSPLPNALQAYFVYPAQRRVATY